jgi:hypothetical protein
MLLLLLIWKIANHPLYLLAPVVLILMIFCLSARLRKHWVLQKRLRVSALDDMEGTHKRVGPDSGSFQTHHSSNLPSQKLSANESNDSLTNGIVIRSPRKSSNDSEVKPETAQRLDESNRPVIPKLALQDLNTEEGFGRLPKKDSGKLSVGSPRMSEEIRIESPPSRAGYSAMVVPEGYGSHPIKLGISTGGPSSSDCQSKVSVQFESEPLDASAAEPLASYDLGISAGKSTEYSLPDDARLRTTSEIESHIIPIHDPTLPLPAATTAGEATSRRQRPNYRGAFSVHESDPACDEADDDSPSLVSSRQRKLTPRKLSSKMSGTVKRIFSRVISKQFSLPNDDQSNGSDDDDFDSSDWSDSRFSFDSDDEEDSGDELDVISIDRKIAQARSRKSKFPMSP